MNRKDYVLIAGIINDMPDTHVREQCAKAFAYALQEQHRSFDIDLFLCVCLDASRNRNSLLNMDKKPPEGRL
jgi:hypothetical protein